MLDQELIIGVFVYVCRPNVTETLDTVEGVIPWRSAISQ